MQNVDSSVEELPETFTSDPIVDDQGKTIMTYKKMNDSYSEKINWEKIAVEMLPPGSITEEITQKYTEKIMIRKGNRILKIKTQREE